MADFEKLVDDDDEGLEVEDVIKTARVGEENLLEGDLSASMF
jgi:hypothetical protein